MTSRRSVTGKTPVKGKSSSSSNMSSSLMTVAVRVRPLSTKEHETGHRPVVFAQTSNIASIAKLERSGAVLQSEKGQMHAYEFDQVFGETATNEQVYRETARSLIPKVLDGVNCTIFAYGATGAGKTHSIMGTEQDPGMMPRSMIDLFKCIEHSNDPTSFSVIVSYMEVYCETIRDLLSDSEKSLNPCEHATDGTVKVLGLTEREVTCVEEVLNLVREGSERRKTEATKANEFSSRSHAVLQVKVQKTLPPNISHIPPPSVQMTTKLNERKPGGDSRRQSVNRIVLQTAQEPVIRQSRLSLIDLAGSERAAATMNTGARLREGANINKSLLALANCINALSNGSERVKYRDSKLTHLLKSSLEGDCRVAMLAAVTPSHKSYEESHNTLKYAHRAKNIKTNAVISQPAIAAVHLPPVAVTFPSISPQRPVTPEKLDENLNSSATKKSTSKVATLIKVFENKAVKEFEISEENDFENANPNDNNSNNNEKKILTKENRPSVEKKYILKLEEERNELLVELQRAKDEIAVLKMKSLAAMAIPSTTRRPTVTRLRKNSVN